LAAEVGVEVAGVGDFGSAEEELAELEGGEPPEPLTTHKVKKVGRRSFKRRRMTTNILRSN